MDETPARSTAGEGVKTLGLKMNMPYRPATCDVVIIVVLVVHGLTGREKLIWTYWFSPKFACI